MTSQQYCLRWNNHRSNLLNVFEELLNNAAFTDVILAVDNGLTVKCHKIVLAACSTYFQRLFQDLSSYQHPIIVLKDVRYDEMKAILEYMYRGEVNVAHDQLSGLLKVAQVLKVKGLVEEHGGQSGTARDFRREDTMDPSESPPPAISTSTGGGGGGGGGGGSGSHSSPPHSTGGYHPIHGKSAVSLDRGQSHLAGSLPVTWPLSMHSVGHQIPTSHTSSFVLGGGGGGGGGVVGTYDNGIETSPLKRRKIMLSSLSNDTPILRGVLGQAQPHVDSSQAMPLPQPDSHEPVNYRNASSNGSTNDSDNRRSSDLAHSETVHPDVSYMDDDDRQPSPQSYGGGDTVRNSAVTDCAQPKPEWKRYKQYTRDDITAAIEAVRNGMSAVQAARKYGVPSRTLYDKVKKLGIPTSRPFKRSASNGGSGACFPYGIGANVNGAVYDGSIGSGSNALSETENESGNIGIAEGLAGTSAAAAFESTYAKAAKERSRDSSPVIRCAKPRQQLQQLDLDDQVEDLSVSRKSDVPVIVPPSTTSAAIKDEAQDSNDCCDYS